jgi:hypothetical protein
MTVLDLLLLQFGIIPFKTVPFVNYTTGPASFQLLDTSVEIAMLCCPESTVIRLKIITVSSNLHPFK